MCVLGSEVPIDDAGQPELLTRLAARWPGPAVDVDFRHATLSGAEAGTGQPRARDAFGPGTDAER